MKKLSLFLMAVSLVFASCVTSGKKEISEEEKIRQKKIARAENITKANYKKADEYATNIRNNPDIYWGEGMAIIGTDLGKCKELARQTAIKNLSGQIKTRVKSDVEVLVNKKSALMGSSYTNDVKRSFNEKLKTYTSQVLTDIHESRLFIDYPKKDTATYYVYINKKDYEQKVKKDLNQKKNFITSNIKNGDNNFKSGNYMASMKDYINAKEMKNSFFSSLPVYEDIYRTGEKQEVSGYIKNRINSFLSSIELSLLNKDFTYSAQGRLDKSLEVYAQFTDSSGEKKPVKGLPLKFEVIKGSMNVKLPVTGSYGETELSVVKIDPSFKEIIAQISVDIDKITEGSEEVAAGNSTLKLKLSRQNSVAVAAVFLNNGKKYLPQNVKDHVKSTILNKKFSIIDIPYKDSLKDDLSYLNADYLVVIKVLSSGGGVVGNFSNMYASNCSAVISLYSLPDKNLIAQKNTGAKKGFGVSIESAGWDGFGKNRQNIIKKSDYIIESIQ